MKRVSFESMVGLEKEIAHLEGRKLTLLAEIEKAEKEVKKIRDEAEKYVSKMKTMANNEIVTSKREIGKLAKSAEFRMKN